MTGTAAAAPVVPDLAPSCLVLASIVVPSGLAVITLLNLADRRVRHGMAGGLMAYRETHLPQSDIQQNPVALNGLSPLWISSDGTRLIRLKVGVLAFKNTSDTAGLVQVWLAVGAPVSLYLQVGGVFVQTGGTAGIFVERSLVIPAGTWQFEVQMSTMLSFVNVAGDIGTIQRPSMFYAEDIGPDPGGLAAPWGPVTGQRPEFEFPSQRPT